MTQAVVEHFIVPLSACFTARPGQDFTMFAKLLIEDLQTYSAPILDDAAVTIRRSHKSSTWPTIAQCLDAVRESAHRSYRPPESEPLPSRKFVPLPILQLDPGGSFLTKSEMLACPVGTQFWVSDATIHYPNGSHESWGTFRRRRAAERGSAIA